MRKNRNNSPWWRMPGRLCLSLLLIVAPPVYAQGLPGDVNLDGEINVLDVQGTVNIALGGARGSDVADVDGNRAIDVLDVQTVTNTALGTGGLVQEVRGRLAAASPEEEWAALAVAAVSLDGRMRVANVSGANREFALSLDVQTAWHLVIVATSATGPAGVGSIAFDAAGELSTVLPLPNLSANQVLDLGTIEVGWNSAAAVDVRRLVGEAGDTIDPTDANANGLADALEALLFPLPNEVPFRFVSLAGLDTAPLAAAIGECLGDAAAGVLRPDLVGMESDGVPSALAPLFDCVDASLPVWLEANITGAPNLLNIPFYLEYYRGWLRQQVRPWLQTLDRPDVTDTNMNAIPDYLEPLLCTDGEGAACALDSGAAGQPVFAQDHDGDGVMNLFDPDAARADDADADGVPNSTDIDADNDGVPNYADNAPLNRDLD